MLLMLIPHPETYWAQPPFLGESIALHTIELIPVHDEYIHQEIYTQAIHGVDVPYIR